jgi:ADP-heptose:LPS heptosyltransferase
MHGGSTASIIAALSGADHTIGYRDYSMSRLLRARAPSPDVIVGRQKMHSVEQQLALLSWAGVPVPASPRLSLAVTARAEASVIERLAALGITQPEGGFALIAPAAALESKRWPAAGFAAVTDYLSERWGLKSIIVAGPGQESVAREVSQASRAQPRALTGIGLKELMALTRMSRVFVGNDSGPMHIAAAFARPIVAIFGSSNEAVWHPWTDSPYSVIRGRARSLSTAGWPSSDDVIAATGEVLESAAAATQKL